MPTDQDLLERPIYTKDDVYVGVVDDIDNENINNENGKLIVRDRNDLWTHSVSVSF